ncbi:sodium:solute symporter [Nitzschia inconspicua]|uniref:Sodium:solute symporter n=1 Tax=Nitzschia inconspicua TaxID=303405 RepID=A0A9K3KP18_9STRA|nr:sodium:solute symporter [Nitzschia inconspicua]
MGTSLSGSFVIWLLSTLLATIDQVAGQTQCISDPTIAAAFEDTEGSCCMNDVCGLPCPTPVSPPAVGFGIVIGVGIAISFLVGFATLFLVHGEAENFFVAGRSLPLWIVSMTLGAQSIDSNAILGNADLSYKYHFYDGAVLPIGLGLSLILNGLFLARHINAERNVLTLPDVFAKRYGRVVEVLVSIASIVSFMMLLAGNLVGMGVILSYVWGFSVEAAIWTTFVIVWVYTVSGGLFSVAYTDVVQGIMGWSGCFVFAYYMIANQNPQAPPPSIGFPGYVYPDLQGDGGICDMYQGVACTNNATMCCYNAPLWCPSDENCTTDNGAYPIGDRPVFPNQLTDFLALSPFPNAIMWDWATIFVLGLGNLAALDFQARCMAAKTPSIATYGCLIGGAFTFFVGIPFAYMGSITRVYYGPDSIHASFATDTCHPLLGLPTCALWEPDPQAFLHLLTHDVPAFLGGWCLLGIVTASMSTADGAILAMGTVFAHNIVRQLDVWRPDLISAENLLWATRLATIPLSLSSTLIAAYYTSDNPQGATGYLLIVAFDVMLATCVVPLFGCFYCKNPSPNAALLSILAGAITRTVLEFTLPKDGYLLLPYDVPEFQDVGPAASAKFPVFFDEPAENLWNPEEEVCDTRQFEDFTGVDSLSALLASFTVFVLVQFIEVQLGRPMFTLPGLQPYIKNIKTEEPDELGKSGGTKPEGQLEDDSGKNEVEMAQKEDSEEHE